MGRHDIYIDRGAIDIFVVLTTVRDAVLYKRAFHARLVLDHDILVRSQTYVVMLHNGRCDKMRWNIPFEFEGIWRTETSHIATVSHCIRQIAVLVMHVARVMEAKVVAELMEVHRDFVGNVSRYPHAARFRFIAWPQQSQTAKPTQVAFRKNVDARVEIIEVVFQCVLQVCVGVICPIIRFAFKLVESFIVRVARHTNCNRNYFSHEIEFPPGTRPHHILHVHSCVICP